MYNYGNCFADWLNKYSIQPTDQKVKFIKRIFQADDEEKKLPHIYF
jgi:hypothetical protein